MESDSEESRRCRRITRSHSLSSNASNSSDTSQRRKVKAKRSNKRVVPTVIESDTAAESEWEREYETPESGEGSGKQIIAHIFSILTTLKVFISSIFRIDFFFK